MKAEGQVNWRELFWKYAETVNREEGVNFLFEPEWSGEERDAIRELWVEKGYKDPFQ